jgi:hypothetical protein
MEGMIMTGSSIRRRAAATARIGWVALVVGLVAGCGGASISADTGEEFIGYLNDGDLEAARAMVCEEERDTLVDRVMGNQSMVPEGVDMLGLSSPGLRDISCTVEDDTIVCTFVRPQLQCSGDLLGGGEVTCSSFTPEGLPAELTLEMSGEEICGSSFRDLS